MKKRIFVEKKEEYQTTARNLLMDLQRTLDLKSLKSLKIINVYDVFNVNDDVLNKAKETLLSEKATDCVYEVYDIDNLNYLGIESVLGQFDQRADSAIRGIFLLGGTKDADVKTSVMYVFNDDLTSEDKEKIEKFLINPLETQSKDYSLPLDNSMNIEIKDVEIIDGFINYDKDKLNELINIQGLAMRLEDIIFIQEYFNRIKRNPTITELLALDTYWSDHCRHTTFETHLQEIDFSKSNIKDEIEDAYNIYLKLRNELKRDNKPMTLMDMASIQAKYQKKNGTLDDLEESDEVNACSIEIDVDIDGKDEKYLLMYKNETHNHPTEIEPFGGAATCVGGAIRDPLSGRAYVYQAMRITGAGDISEDVDKTRANKLPQKVIAQRAAAGNSSYGNQIGVPTTYLKEYYHPGFVAKRMELGAVVGAVKKEDIKRDKPVPGDYIIMLGAPTGRDGVGGATGSSKVQGKNALEEAKSEVQKGNAPEERKIQRLFRNPNLTKLIKKGNDLGAGGVSVAIGELADGVLIDLNSLPTKYAGLNGTDLALSESQERMVMVIDPKDFDEFVRLSNEENVEAIKVAEVTDDNKLTMVWNDKKIIEIDREFLNTNGIPHKISPIITSTTNDNPFRNKELIKDNFKDSINKLVSSLDFASQRGLATMFDNTVGRSTVLATYGGKYQNTLSEASIQKIPVLNGTTKTASILAHGYNPLVGLYEPFYAGSYAIIESVARIIACGGSLDKIRLSLQEYFEKVSNQPERFGKPVAALLGALKAQYELNLPALGGKDSMSGSFEELDVPPTLVSFAISTIDCDKVISQEIKNENDYVYVLLPEKSEKVNYTKLKDNFNLLNKLRQEYSINACASIKNGGIIAELINMSYGNNIGVNLNDSLSLDDLFYAYYGGFIIVSSEKIDNLELVLIGETKADKISYLNEEVEIKDLLTKAQTTLEKVYPTIYAHKEYKFDNISYQDLELNKKDILEKTKYSFEKIEEPLVYLPIFMGTNCEYDVQKAFEQVGAKTIIEPFVDLDEESIEKSIDKMVSILDKANILALSGGFSAADEPDGSGKYILNVLLNEKVKEAIKRFQAREGLIIGICNGFQVLVKSGLLPYGKIGEIKEDMPTLFLNENGKHLSCFVDTKILKTNSPWTTKEMEDKIYTLAISHGEGKLMASKSELERLYSNNQIISQYVDKDGNPSMDYRYNPNGSYASIEGMISPDGRIIGKMAHSERYEDGTFKNIVGEKELMIFKAAVDYFKKK